MVKCVICGKLFEPTSARSKYCSHKCVNAARREHYAQGKPVKPLKMIECAICGARFQPRDARQKYCSWECGQEANRQRAHDRHLTHNAEIRAYYRERYQAKKQEAKKSDEVR